ncbi:AAA domain-containing protein [Paenibacillus taihuensis]|uniref:AAA domain-containing protein n=1 Tax=Paenibacillus taihuensis TaxID=1156355 RepID=A0A3D9RP31_9BACL|nr:ATP-binding protein [Paenibacillus taihuensis]REE77752.1 AAA domain-containing protein [Paenibacillus taihuensis]
MSMGQVREAERPSIPEGTHQLIQDKYLVPTNEIMRLYRKVDEWIEDRSPGGIIFGRQRRGKTQAIKYIEKKLTLRYGDELPIFVIPAKHKFTANEEVFYEWLLLWVGHAFPYAGKKNHKFDRLAKFLLEKGEKSKYKQIVMFMDEAQALLEQHYKWLIDLYNYLNAFQIKLIILLVGQPELKLTKSSFVTQGMNHIVGRFMINEHELFGAKTVTDFQVCLKGYDTIEYPEGSGWSYTRYYYPEAYAEGKRLEHCANDLFEAFALVRQERGFGGKMEVGMQDLTTTIKYALAKYGAESKKKNHWIDLATWVECVKKAGYVDSEVSFNVSKLE